MGVAWRLVFVLLLGLAIAGFAYANPSVPGPRGFPNQHHSLEPGAVKEFGVVCPPDAPVLDRPTSYYVKVKVGDTIYELVHKNPDFEKHWVKGEQGVKEGPIDGVATAFVPFPRRRGGIFIVGSTMSSTVLAARPICVDSIPPVCLPLSHHGDVSAFLFADDQSGLDFIHVIRRENAWAVIPKFKEGTDNAVEVEVGSLNAHLPSYLKFGVLDVARNFKSCEGTIKPHCQAKRERQGTGPGVFEVGAAKSAASRTAERPHAAEMMRKCH